MQKIIHPSIFILDSLNLEEVQVRLGWLLWSLEERHNSYFINRQREAAVNKRLVDKNDRPAAQSATVAFDIQVIRRRLPTLILQKSPYMRQEVFVGISILEIH